MGGNEGAARVISAMSTDWAGGEWNKWKHGKFQLNTNVFYSEGGQTLVALGGCVVSICGDDQNLPGHSPGHKALGDLAIARAWAGCSAFQPQLFCDSVNSKPGGN